MSASILTNESLNSWKAWELPAKKQLLSKLEKIASQRTSVTLSHLENQTALQWAKANATIVHPTRGRIAFDPYPYQAAFLEMADEPRRIILKARQIGFSQIFALEALYKAVTEKESTILLVSRSQDLAVNLLRYCYQTYNGLKNPPELIKQNESEMGLANGSRIKSIPANRSTGRGFAATIVYLDEFAYASYAEDIYQSVSPAVSQGGQLVVGSTPNGIGNLFDRLYEAGAGFNKMNVPWHHCPSYYTDAEKAAGIMPEECAWFLRERPKYTETQWASEYDCSFERSGGGVFRGVRELTNAVPQDGALAGHQYVMGVDLGRKIDFTVICVIDTTTNELVYMDRFNRIEWAIQVQRIRVAAEKFRPDVIHVDETGLGDVVIEQLRRELSL